MKRCIVALLLLLLMVGTARAETPTPLPTPVIYPHRWIGVTDNQGHTAIISNGQIPVTTMPTSTPTP